ncbi:MAG TPA: 3-isopropylmalate dehydratase small subunit [Candidatus Dormibacteraeota bacterium]|jgi:3-isopropylmalate/(R)-2-methylmalate dehydratase small subunit|nr:3-isopropylmalate dehydratase small subunit [Candidatus Dormibacteraeota bacterium]
MKPFRRETGVVVPMVKHNVDTDQIIPKQFLKRIERTGYGPFLFNDWRYNQDGSERPDFVLNQAAYRSGNVLIAGRNFGCGSSREHAVWALDQFGFRVVIAPGFADIFRGNSGKEGLLTVQLPEDAVNLLASRAEEEPGVEATVDLESQTVTLGELSYSFEVDPFLKHCLLEGLDDIGLTQAQEDAITAFEAGRPSWMPDMRRKPAARSQTGALA